MSDKVIRVGGTHIGNTISINQLDTYLQRNSKRVFVVVSAIPQILSFVENELKNVFTSKVKSEQITKWLNSVFTEKLNSAPGKSFLNLTQKFVNLIKGIELIGDYSDALKDQVISFSELLSVEILLAQWKKTNPSVQILLPAELKLQASADFGNASFLFVDNEFVSHLKPSIYLVPGSFGITEKGRVARTGRFAADYSAAFLSSALKVPALELWDLDKDFLCADPDIVSNPTKIKRLTYSEASELAYFDHYSFHPRTVEPLENKHIPVHILNSKSDKGEIETIINTESFIDSKIVKSVACTEDISLLKLDGPGVGLKPGILAKVTATLNNAGINIKSVITSQTSINFVLAEKNGNEALNLIHKLGFSAVTDISLVNDIALIGIVGHGMQQAYGVSAKIFTAVANNKINVVLSGSGASDLVSYLVVNKNDKEKSVKVIYNAFFN